MDNTEQIPPGIHLGFAQYCEAVESHDPADVGKRWFDNGNPQTVQSASGHGVDLSLHLFGEGLFALDGTAMKIGCLPNFSSFWMPKTG